MHCWKTVHGRISFAELNKKNLSYFINNLFHSYNLRKKIEKKSILENIEVYTDTISKTRLINIRSKIIVQNIFQEKGNDENSFRNYDLAISLELIK